ncbi:hypothetical protein PIROE2DRAFT_10910 [Piromyces sp. E2]|nr:hypothetical protein PIROE2DRAFT_10910 [Piromyces sp. E2]|eukprot:OUM62704.1 hypothetical protein PIROE2DRAFT_10910 [Piromyces sp. E2]
MSTLYKLTTTASKKANDKLNSPKISLTPKSRTVSSPLSPKIKRTIDEHHKKSKIIRNRNYNYGKSVNQTTFNFNKNNIQKNLQINSSNPLITLHTPSLNSIDQEEEEENHQFILPEENNNTRNEIDTLNSSNLSSKLNNDNDNNLLNTYHDSSSPSPQYSSPLLKSPSTSNLSHSPQINEGEEGNNTREEVAVDKEVDNNHGELPSTVHSQSASSTNSDVNDEEAESLIRDIEISLTETENELDNDNDNDMDYHSNPELQLNDIDINPDTSDDNLQNNQDTTIQNSLPSPHKLSTIEEVSGSVNMEDRAMSVSTSITNISNSASIKEKLNKFLLENGNHLDNLLRSDGLNQMVDYDLDSINQLLNDKDSSEFLESILSPPDPSLINLDNIQLHNSIPESTVLPSPVSKSRRTSKSLPGSGGLLNKEGPTVIPTLNTTNEEIINSEISSKINSLNLNDNLNNNNNNNATLAAATTATTTTNDNHHHDSNNHNNNSINNDDDDEDDNDDTHEIDLLSHPFEPLFKSNKLNKKSSTNEKSTTNKEIIKDKHIKHMEMEHHYHHKKDKEQKKDIKNHQKNDFTGKDGRSKSSHTITIPKSASVGYLKEREQTPSPPDHSVSSKFVNSMKNFIPKVIDTPLFYSTTLSSSSSSGESNTSNLEDIEDQTMEDNQKVDNNTSTTSKDNSNSNNNNNNNNNNNTMRSKSKPSHVSSLRKEILKRNFQHHESDKQDLSNKRLKLDAKTNGKHYHQGTANSNSSSPVENDHGHGHGHGHNKGKEGKTISSFSSHDSSNKKNSSHPDSSPSSNHKGSTITDKYSKIKKSSSAKGASNKLLKKVTSASSLDSYFQNSSLSSRPYMPVGIALKKEQGIITKHGVIPFKNDKSKPIDTIHHEIPVLTGNTANLINSFLSMSNSNGDNKDNKTTTTTTSIPPTPSTITNSIDKYLYNNNNNTVKKKEGN